MRKILFLCILYPVFFNCQIANYVSNGSFENRYNCNLPNDMSKAKYWRSLDSVCNGGGYYSSCSGLGSVPLNSLTYQKSKTGTSYVISNFFCQPPNCPSTGNRGYLRNRLKANLQSGKTYCVKFHVNISNNSTYGMDGFGAYFGDNSLDTITQCIPLTYITPQIQNATNNIITDTLGWTLITGTFVATGNEKHMIIGNFKTTTGTNKVLINPTNLPAIFTDVCIDGVSCIDINLAANAGADQFCIPGNTVYIGQPQDEGIDDACIWYKLPNTTTAIDTAAGIFVSPISTSTYVVKQDICGIIKWDTVIVYQSAVGIQKNEAIKNNFNLFPNPANNELYISFTLDIEANFKTVLIYNSIGALIKEEDISFKNKKTSINTANLPNGIYYISLHSSDLKINKRFVISR
ncbi:MAG: T9SS type A sorting domain-containing protein [Bacteroidetes bacterium]|nr:T9SS type A sorting domain-containing protein [Bacteroidota bacterium]